MGLAATVEGNRQLTGGDPSSGLPERFIDCFIKEYDA